MNIPEAAGIAANQLGINERIIVYRLPQSRSPNDYFDEPCIIINPIIKYKSDEQYNAWEGCLSIPNIKAVVPRSKVIIISGYNENCQYVEKQVSHFHARNIQHEIDHLDGITILDKQYSHIAVRSELNNGIQIVADSITNEMGDF